MDLEELDVEEGNLSLVEAFSVMHTRPVQSTEGLITYLDIISSIKVRT